MSKKKQELYRILDERKKNKNKRELMRDIGENKRYCSNF